jgi:hypothetical protein
MTVKMGLIKNKHNISNLSPKTQCARMRERDFMYVCTYVRMYVSSERPSTSKEICTALMRSAHYVQHNPKNCVGLSSKINNQ